MLGYTVPSPADTVTTDTASLFSFALFRLRNKLNSELAGKFEIRDIEQLECFWTDFMEIVQSNIIFPYGKNQVEELIKKEVWN